MDNQDIYLQQSHRPGTISSSAIDLTGTPAGIASSAPPSPSLEPSQSFSRRRTSWGRLDVGQDPLTLDTTHSFPQPSSNSSPGLQSRPAVYTVNDDPFYSPTDDQAAFGGRDFQVQVPYTDFNTDDFHNNIHNTYSTSQAGPSTASLITPSEFEMDSNPRDDDEAHLTTNMSRSNTEEEDSRWGGGHGAFADGDTERTAGATPRSRRRTVRYSVSPSPLKKTGNTIKSVSQNLRRVSLRVVNFSGTGLEDHVRVRLPDDENDGNRGSGKRFPEDGEDDQRLPDLSKALPIRGRTLGFLGPKSKIRLALYRFLIYPWTEPAILLLIIANAVVLTIQSARSISLDPSSDDDGVPPRVKGYFHSWEDYVLFALFVCFTLEAFARICVSGFLFDPEVPTSTLFSSPFTAFPAPIADFPAQPTSAPSNSSLSRQNSHITQGGPLTRGLSLTQRLKRLNNNLMRPFALNHVASNVRYLNDPEPNAPPSNYTAPSNPFNEKTLNHTKHANNAHSAHPSHAHSPHTPIRDPSHPTYFSNALRSDTRPAAASDVISLPFRLSITQAQDKVHRNVPYLRHSWSRIDFVAIVSFWVMFALATTGLERGSHHIGVFRAMSVIRTARLLTITSGTTTILHSLKTARPLLTSVAYFVLFAIALFSIIGVQSFQGSMRRACYLSPTLGEAEIAFDEQACGGYVDPVSFNTTGFVQLDGRNAETFKGYICPLGQVCREQGNPHDNVQSFDTIYYSALQVIIVASANGWTPVMYSMIDSEFFVSCIFFIVGIIILNFWLINLFVAVITNTFSAIRSETKKSAFGAAPLSPTVERDDDGWSIPDARKVTNTNLAKVIYSYTRWIWVLLALASLVLQATRSVDVSTTHELAMYYGELGITIALDAEIALRFLAALPDWRSFFMHGQNWLDTILAVGSSVIQIPLIHDSAVYPWFTILQLARFYRVILEVPRMRPLLLAVFGNMYGLVNMSLFLILVNYIAALVGVQLLRGDMDSDITMNFSQVFSSFLAIYQVFSSEDWTSVLYDASDSETNLGQTVIVVLFVTLWLLFANFIVLQMFIAVINENFNVAEEAKKGKQATNYWETHQIEAGKASWMRRLNPYRWVKANPVKVKVENLPSNLILPMQKALVQDYTVPKQEARSDLKRSVSGGARHISSKSLSALQRLFNGKTESNDVPLANLRHARNETFGTGDPRDEETERHLELLASVNTDTATSAEDINDALYERRAQKADFIRDHPSYDKTFWIFSQKNPLRRLCQKMVKPAHGERIFGTPQSPVAYTIFSLLIFLAVVGGIAVESVATPIYRRNYYGENGFIRGAWFDIAEATFGFTLLVEFLIKVAADGFSFTPNAYIRSIWNIIDLIILAGLLVNVTTGLIFVGGFNRFTRSLKALRALRLITLMDIMRNTFKSLIISGASRILDAAVLAILYMIPYAVWGLNIFAGKMNVCNDGDVDDSLGCINEYTVTVYGESFGFLAPRVWDNPSPSTTFSFDSFRASLLILFEIVSLEGWIDVMNAATSIVGIGQQPQNNASQVNALFFLIYHLIGGVVILTLFVSIIIGNFSSKTGTAFLTKPQREWIDLQKLFKRQRPSKRPHIRPISPVRAWCFDRAVYKHGWWSRGMTFLFVLHIFALMTQTFSTQELGDTLRNAFFLAISFIYIIDVVVRLIGLGWRSYRANGWNVFDMVVAAGSFITTLIVRFDSGNGYAIQQLQKLFLVSIAFKLVQRMNSLNKLFKTAMASLPVIISLLGLWLILFLFFAILFVEVFGLTKWHSGETRNMNYTSIGKALVMLAFMSTGEGWNQYMHDYAIVYPRCTNSSASEAESDCGSVGWAFALFIVWNLLSMYIFVNMFTGVVVENFSYVFQTSTGGAKSITREEMRSFKKVWAEFANPKTRELERNRFVPFFAKLSGVFEVRIYPAEYTIPRIMGASKQSSEAELAWAPRVVDGVDLDKLDRVLNSIDYVNIRKRRALYSRLFHEATIASHNGRGIDFTHMLMLLAHHKLIIDREALDLKDLVQRTEVNKLVTDLVNLDRVRSLLKTISHRRRFLAHMQQVRAAKMEHDIPSIVVDVMPATPPASTRDISSLGYDGSAPSSPSPSQRFQPPDILLGSPGSGLQRSSRRNSDISMLSTDLGYKYPRDSISEDDPQNVLSSMENSMWGDLMSEAMKEEENR